MIMHNLAGQVLVCCHVEGETQALGCFVYCPIVREDKPIKMIVITDPDDWVVQPTKVACPAEMITMGVPACMVGIELLQIGPRTPLCWSIVAKKVCQGCRNNSC